MAQREEITELLREGEHLREVTGNKATFFKTLSVILTTIIIVSGVVVGVAAASESTTFRYWGPLILGPLISALKLFTSSFKVESQGVANMQIATKVSAFIRKIRRIQRKRLSEEEVDDALDSLGKELDMMKLSVFCTESLKRMQETRTTNQASVSISAESPTSV